MWDAARTCAHPRRLAERLSTSPCNNSGRQHISADRGGQRRRAMLLFAALAVRAAVGNELAEGGEGAPRDHGSWTPVEEKIFQAALAVHRDHPRKWQEIARLLPFKDAAACELHGRELQVSRRREGSAG
ncbi:unnamed protein product [Ostreobium quekettii]|uniref:Myb-like domain-containing protein n=1 Tax=Ostreobium quekettii TaxID=121088 RepID=A0A8S1JEX7_9CHLO|nr:unnamed protein product [Ostreobium quekettii]